ncbi:hypothetical protein [Poritiphilus flavus]|uniref:Uncharacterized protein n=1 Tax=Poritiphilus flavus TaxID=2697053 RepID=A0A6L9EBE3_9FLAO|nr:hypothetical protein [Poritiphilus flavus]NAS11868.1 hypothetical protein [Poritiphilus flavus]
MKSSNIFYTGLLLWMSLACSKSDDEISPPELRFSEEVITPFYTAGSSAPPMVNWNGNKGRFGIKNAVKGISIDSNSGIVSWKKTLPTGLNVIEVLAFNNAGSTSAFLEIEHLFHGEFKGLFDTFILVEGEPIFINLKFNPEGSCSYEHFSTSVEGFWEISKDSINALFFFEGEEVDQRFLKGIVVHTNEEAYIEGVMGFELGELLPTENFRADLIE